MKCKVCGAYNEDYLEYCENCAAPLTPDTGAAEPATKGYQAPASAAEENKEAPAWGFVKPPAWPKPDFSANNVSEDDIPENYRRKFEPRAAAQSVPPVNAAYAPESQAAKAPVSAPEAFVRQAAPEYAPRPAAPEYAPRQAAPGYTQPVQSAAVEDVPAFSIGGGSAYTDDDGYVNDVQASVKYAEPVNDDGFYDYDADPKEREYSGKYGKTQRKAAPSSRKRSASRRGRGGKMDMRKFIYIGAAAVLVIAIVIFGVIIINKEYGGSFSNMTANVFGGNPLRKPSVITDEVREDGSDGCVISIYANPGTTMRFTAGQVVKEAPITTSALSMRITKRVWIPDEPLDVAELSVTPDVVIISADGKETKVEFEDPVIIKIPSIELNITTPATTELTTDTPTIAVAGTVGDNTASVFIDDVQVSVDEAGNFNTTYNVPGAGNYTITVEARKNGYQIARKTINVVYGSAGAASGTDAAGTGVVEGNIPITIDEGVKQRDTAETIAVSGSVEPGVAITVSGVELVGDVTMDSATGKFNFTVSMPKAGLYTTVITATKDNASSSKTLYLEHNPEKDSYMQNVYALDYARIRDYPNHEQGYKVVGKVIEIIQSEPYVKARIQTADGDIIFSYYSGIAEISTSDGKTYELYADPAGTDEGTGLPNMHAWYIKKRS